MSEMYATTPQRRGGAWGIGLIGAVLAATAVVYGVRLARTTALAVYPVFDAVVLFVLGGTVAAAGYWLGQSDIDGAELWTIATAVGLGVIATATLAGWLLLVRARQGVPVRDPLVTLAVVTTVGALGGLLGGVYHVNSVRQVRAAERTARNAREREESLRFLTNLLRHHLLNGVQIIRSHADFLADHVDAEGTQHVETIRCRSDRLAGLLTNMQVLVDTYESEPDLEPVGLLDTIDAQAAALERAYPGTAVEVTGPDTDATDDPHGAALAVSADGLLPVVFETLFETAAERTAVAEPTLSVEAARRHGRAVVTVAAPGPELDGCTDLLLDRTQLDTAGEDRLGFYVVERLVNGYGGDLVVEDADGPRYRVELPLAG